CILRHQIYGRKNFIDSYYIFKSKLLWKFWSCNEDNINYKYKKSVLKLKYKPIRLLCFVIGVLPYLLVNRIETKLKNKINSIKHKIALLKK
ncbi:hypothetical protein, partial [Gilliamella sp. wkB292]|uniref:hypothetical protein n=1 Tax=Gilliamella sp. wkB292 TaxID=3120262 RepID=UPI001C401136